MKTTRKINVPIYNFTIYFTVFDKWEEVSKIFGSETNQREGFLLTSSQYPTILKMYTDSACENNVVHEAIHIKNIIFDTIGHKCDYDNDEPETYLVEYLYDKLIKVFKLHNKNNAKT